MAQRHAVPSSEVDPAQRLTAIGLPPRAPGWVPQRPATVGVPIERVDGHHAEPVTPPLTRLDELRAALADRLPPQLGARVEAASSGAILTTLVVVVVVVIGIALKLHSHHSTGYGDYAGPSYNDAPAATAPTDPALDGSSIVVDVGGRVRHPGLVTLPFGARVADAIRAAGGPLHRRELRHVNRAARVADGQLLVIGGRPAKADGDDDSTPVSLSTASLEDLDGLPGVGPVTAQKIIDWRTAHGGFTSVSQLQQVSGIGPARYAELAPLVTP
jgi:competence protein ComEA